MAEAEKISESHGRPASNLDRDGCLESPHASSACIPTGMASVWTIESSVSNLVVSEDSTKLEARELEREQDECPPKRQRISEEPVQLGSDAMPLGEAAAVSFSPRDREGFEVPPNKCAPCSPDSEGDSPCQYVDCFITQYSCPRHVHVLGESTKSRLKTRKTVAERNNQTQRSRQGLQTKLVQCSRDSAGDVDTLSHRASTALPAAVGCRAGDRSVGKTKTDVDSTASLPRDTSASYTDPGNGNGQNSYTGQPALDRSAITSDIVVDSAECMHVDNDSCHTLMGVRPLKREANRASKHHTSNIISTGSVDKLGNSSQKNTCREDFSLAHTFNDRFGTSAEDAPGSSTPVCGSKNQKLETTSLTDSTLDNVHYMHNPCLYSSLWASGEAENTHITPVLAEHAEHPQTKLHHPSLNAAPALTADTDAARQVCRVDGDKEQGMNRHLKRFVPYPGGADSSSQSSELDDSGSDGSVIFSSLSGGSCHDDSLFSDHSNSPTFVQKGPLTIDDLPTVILIQIFSWLPIATRLGAVNRVCKAWQSVVLDPSLWRYLDLTDLPRLKDSALLQVASYSDRVHTMVMTDGKSTLLTDSGMVQVLAQCSHLRKVDISHSFFLSNESFSALGKYCQKLTCINLDGCFSLADVSLEAIGAGCPELEELNISQCSKVSDQGVCAIAAGCPRLTRFRLDQCVKVTDEGVITLTTHCPDLKYLHLLSCSLTDLSISHLNKLQKLHTLDVSNISHLSPRCLETVALGCPKLETLGLSLNRAVDDQCLRTVSQACPGLKHLSCVACSLSDTGLEHLGKYARNLERLDVAWCGDITEIGITAVATGCQDLNYLGFMRCSRVHMPAVEELVYRYPHIKFSNFFLESKRLLAKAQTQGFTLPTTALLSDR